MSLPTIREAAAVACSACNRLRSRVRSTTNAAIRRAMLRSSSTGPAGGSQGTSGIRITNSRRATAAVRSVFDTA